MWGNLLKNFAGLWFTVKIVLDSDDINVTADTNVEDGKDDIEMPILCNVTKMTLLTYEAEPVFSVQAWMLDAERKKGQIWRGSDWNMLRRF